MYYVSGVYHPVNNNCGNSINHGVLLVGKQNGAYIVKNSWGTNWGESGYYRQTIGTGNGTCGISTAWYNVRPIV